MKKIGIIVQHFSPYLDATLMKLSNEYEIVAFALNNEPTTHKEWKYTTCMTYTASKKKVYLGEKLGYFHFGIIKFLITNFDCLIISGLYPATNMFAIFISIIAKRKYVYMADTVERSTKNEYIYKKILNNAKAIWCPGRKSQEFFSHYVSVDKIYEGCYMLDVPMLLGELYISESERNMTRSKYGIANDDFVYLFVGKLIKERKIQNLLEAYDTIKNDKTKLIVIGDGEESDYLRHLDTESIVWIPSVPFEQLHTFYAISDCYVHPGKEPYSLAVAEAAYAKMPIICSNVVGAAYDYIISGKNGYILSTDTIEELAERMRDVLSDTLHIEDIERIYSDAIIKRDGNWAANELIQAIK